MHAPCNRDILQKPNRITFKERDKQAFFLNAECFMSREFTSWTQVVASDFRIVDFPLRGLCQISFEIPDETTVSC